ncbi:MAG TPA: hypothetical protein VND94_16480 [Terriglobia bacterium]|nr:hypothetical protein [Terriglobia bacterium]
MILHNIILLLLVAAAIAALIAIYRRDQRRLRARRSQLFKACHELFAEIQERQDGLGYPTLTGLYRGRRFHIDAVIDHIAVRKVPSLWLRVSLLAERPHLATLDILMRPQNVEFYSPANDLPHRIEVPEGWPSEAVLHSDDPERMLSLQVVTPHLDFFRQPQAKEMLITPKGLRLVYQASQADKLHYQVLRQANFALPVLAPALLRDLMDRLIALDLAIDAVPPAAQAS